MGYRGQELSFFDFRGGLASAKPATLLDVTEASELRNVYVTPGGGIAKRRGDTEFNGTAMSTGAAVHGLGYYKQEDNDEYLMAIAGTSLFKSDSLDGTMDDITGTLTITTGQDNIWDIFTFNNNVIGVGGAPDAPWTWTGTGNGAALGGSPPSGNFGFQHNNRVFIGSTTADPSTIYWSVLSDAADWSGAGSGSQTIWTSDNDKLVGYAILNSDTILLFKQNSIHQMVGRTAPFPVYPVLRGTGAVGKHAIVEADGLVYFITPKGRMAVTDGSRIIGIETLPRLDYIDDAWDGLNMSRLPYIQGVRYKGRDFDHILWSCSNSTSTTNNYGLIWDLRNQCWLLQSSGIDVNCWAKTQSGVLYGGHYNGKIYRKDVADTYSDASETAPGAIDGLWRWGWQVQNSLIYSKHPARINVVFDRQDEGFLTVGYGFDYSADKVTTSLSMGGQQSFWGTFVWGVDAWGGQSDVQDTVFVRGRGNAFQTSFRNNVADQNFVMHGFTVSGKRSAQKELVAQ